MLKTKNDLPESTRKNICKLLNQSVSEAIDLAYQAKQAHWNVKGLQFRSLHKLFDQVFKVAVKYGDEFAERAVQLGGIAEGTIRSAGKRSSLPEYPLDAISAVEHVDTLSDRLAHFGKNIRAGIKTCEDADDIASSDIYTEAARAVDKMTWMLEAHLGESVAKEQLKEVKTA